jgi:hypothetical protein
MDGVVSTTARNDGDRDLVLLQVNGLIVDTQTVSDVLDARSQDYAHFIPCSAVPALSASPTWRRTLSPPHAGSAAPSPALNPGGGFLNDARLRRRPFLTAATSDRPATLRNQSDLVSRVVDVL